MVKKLTYFTDEKVYFKNLMTYSHESLIQTQSIMIFS